MPLNVMLFYALSNTSEKYKKSVTISGQLS